MTFNTKNVKTFNVAVVAFEELYLGDDLIADHSDMDDEAQTLPLSIPKIKTELKSEDGKKEIYIGRQNVTVIDTVTYSNLTPGIEYEIDGDLHVKGEEGAVINETAEGSFGSIRFTPQEPNGEVKVKLTITPKYATKTLVAFERLYLAGASREEPPLAEHAEIDDEDQSIMVLKETDIANDTVTPKEANKSATKSDLLKTGSTVAVPVVIIVGSMVALVATMHGKRRHES
jgi:hypothetical protein